MNKVYTVIVNYNKYDDTIECLESVLKSNYLNFQIFIVDNSRDNTSEIRFSDWVNNNNYKDLKTDFGNLVFPLEPKPLSHLTFTESEFNNWDKSIEQKLIFIRAKNKGFAAANNIVLSYVLKNDNGSSLVWLLNNDTVVEKDTLSKLAAFYEQAPNNRYLLGAKLRYYGNPGCIQAVGGHYNKWIGKHTHIGDGEEDLGQYDSYLPGKMDYLVGASLFFPVLFIKEAGVMCEDYFLYFEELDWIKTAIKKGFKTTVVHDALVYHKEGSSIIGVEAGKRDTSIAEYYSITNRVKFIKKWYPGHLITIMPGVIWALTKRIFQGKFKLVKKSSIAIFKILFTSNFVHFAND